MADQIDPTGGNDEKELADRVAGIGANDFSRRKNEVLGGAHQKDDKSVN